MVPKPIPKVCPCPVAALAVLLAATCLAPEPAAARDMTGKAGVGFAARLDRSPLSAPSLTFRYWRDTLSFEFIFGFDWDVLDTSLHDERVLHGGAGALWMVHDSRNLSVSVGGRVFVEVNSLDTERQSIPMVVDSDGTTRVTDCLNNTTDRVQLMFALPLQVEYFLSDHSSLTAAVGVTVGGGGLLPNDSCKDVEESAYDATSGITIRVAGRYSGGIGYTYYF